MEVFLLLESIDRKKSFGYDRIHPLLLSSAALEIFRPVTYIINLTLKQGIFPDSLKVAKVIPVFKQGPRSSCGNYRPISVLSALSKIFERCILNQLKFSCLTENILASNQCGFRSGYNTTDCLVDLIEEITKALDEEKYAVSIFLDLSKAFDTVNHSILLPKLDLYGIRGNGNQWFRSYLSNRKQKVFVNGVESNFLLVNSGVPQGSMLGPFLFLIYINDISRKIMSNTKLFADDTKVYRILRDTKEDVEELQKDLIRLESWSNDWRLKFNTDKCEAMCMSKKNDYSSPQYQLCGNQLKAVSEVKDLGIYITSNLSWSMQANKCANKANSVLRFIRRTVGPKNPQLFSKLYKILVSLILEYCSPVWCPHL